MDRKDWIWTAGAMFCAAILLGLAYCTNKEEERPLRVLTPAEMKCLGEFPPEMRDRLDQCDPREPVCECKKRLQELDRLYHPNRRQ